MDTEFAGEFRLRYASSVVAGSNVVDLAFGKLCVTMALSSWSPFRPSISPIAMPLRVISPTLALFVSRIVQGRPKKQMGGVHA